jgi:Skp family chaperone for outer membrane proteins
MRKTVLIAAASAAILTPAAASAQVASIATANPVVSIARSKAYQSANQQIGTTYKAQLDQLDQKAQQRQTLLAQLDKNHDKQVNDAELKAAKTAKSPVLRQIDQIEKDMSTLQRPAITAQLFALEQVLQRYSAAQTKVIADRHIGLLVRPDSVMYETPAADVTDTITAELDRSVPSVSITPPANWQPTETAMRLQQQINELSQIASQQRAGPPAAAPAAAAPPTQQPQGR